MRRELLVSIVLILAIAVFATTVVALPCTILSGHGPLPDADCDGVHDAIDNCPLNPNAEQLDSNRNGAGDSCDLTIEETVLEPETPVAGENARLTLLVLNNRELPIRDLTLHVKDLEISLNTLTDIGMLPTGEAERVQFLISVPKCQRVGTSTITVTAEYYFGDRFYSEKSSVPLKVAKGGECGPVTLMDKTLVDTFSSQDLQPGERLIIPVRITNLNDREVTYKISAYGLGDWGTYRVDPKSEFVLAAGHDATMYVAVETEEYAPLGKTQLFLRIQAGAAQEDVPVTLNVYKTMAVAKSEGSLQRLLELALILVLFLLLIFGCILVLVKALARKTEGAATVPAPKAPKRATPANKATQTTPAAPRPVKRAVEPVPEKKRSNF